jgi:hypothetical protein
MEESLSFHLDVAGRYKKLKSAHDLGCADPNEVRNLGLAAHSLLFTTYPKLNPLGEGDYFTFGDIKSQAGVSRPIRTELFIVDPDEFESRWNAMVSSVGNTEADRRESNRAIYTCIQAFAASYDLFNRGARKTPGTFFEIILGSLLSIRISGKREKQVILKVNGETATVPTDIYFPSANFVVAAKVSTRDRIVQAWSHQLLLDNIGSVLGLPPFRSILCVVGEVQLGNKPSQPYYPVTVQNQVALYQRHVAQLTGLYYLDPPAGYLALHKQGIIPVLTIGDLLHGELP